MHVTKNIISLALQLIQKKSWQSCIDTPSKQHQVLGDVDDLKKSHLPSLIHVKKSMPWAEDTPSHFAMNLLFGQALIILSFHITF